MSVVGRFFVFILLGANTAFMNQVTGLNHHFILKVIESSFVLQELWDLY